MKFIQERAKELQELHKWQAIAFVHVIEIQTNAQLSEPELEPEFTMVGIFTEHSSIFCFVNDKDDRGFKATCIKECLARLYEDFYKNKPGYRRFDFSQWLELLKITSTARKY